MRPSRPGPSQAPLLFFASLCAGLVACTRPSSSPPPAAPSPSLRLADLAPARVADLCAESPRAWELRAGDEVVAHVRGRCLGKEPRGTHFFTQVIPTQDGRPAQETHLWLGRDGRPRHAQIRSATEVTRVRWVPEGLLVTRHGDDRLIQVTSGPAPWVLTRHNVPARELMLRLATPGAGGDLSLRAWIPARDEVVTLPLELVGDGDHVEARSPHGTLVLALQGGRWATAHILSATDTAGATIYAQADAGDFEPVFPETPQPRYTRPADLEVRPVIIPREGDGPALAGEIVLPADAGDAPRCGVVFLSGSGPQDRHGFVPGTSIDIGSHEVQDALARAGCAVLRFDDRGVGASEAGPKNPGFEDVVADARRAVEFLMNRPEVDPHRVVIVGHSEGAMIAARLGHERVRVGRRPVRPAAVVLMAMPGRNLREIIESQTRYTMKGKPEAEIEEAIAKTRTVHDKIEAGEPVPANLAPVAKYLRQMFQFDPVHELETLRVPVYLAQGSKDFQISPQEDFFPLARLLRKPAPPEGEARVFDGLDHLFKPEPGTSSVGHYGDLSRHVDPDFIAAVVAWVREQVGEPKT